MSKDKKIENFDETQAELEARLKEREDFDAEPVEIIDEESEQDIATAHDDYNWAAAHRKGQKYTKKEFDDYLSDYDSSYREVSEGEVLTGVVTSIRNGDVVLDINYKSDGLVGLGEFRDTPDLSVGDSIAVYVEQREDERGRLVLSRRKAKLLTAWEHLVKSFEEGTIIKGTVISKTKGGLIVDAGRFGNIPSGITDRYQAYH